MRRRLFWILSTCEVLFFILDMSMRWSGQWNILSYHSLSATFPIFFGVLSIPVLYFLHQEYTQHAYVIALGLQAIFLGMVGATLDSILFGAIVDWMYISSLALNMGDVFIVGGIASILFGKMFRI